MTYLKKHRNNIKQIRLYMSFLEECTDFDIRLKLITEIGRLNQQNKAIEKMSFEDIQQDCNDYIVEVPAIF